ncbi:MAG: permease [Mesosutterella sp.]|nr:permease [Mesosutterella sp.]
MKALPFRLRPALLGLVLFAGWSATYAALPASSRLFAFRVLGLDPASAAGQAAEFFFYDSTKILMLLVLMIYVISWLRAGLKLERVRSCLAGRGRLPGYALAALFGAVTPFCSCSSIPLFLGFTSAGIPFGITMAFLITSPLVNEVAVLLLWGLLGWKFTILYVLTGLAAGVAGGLLMDAMRAERWLRPFARELSGQAPAPAAAGAPPRPFGFAERHAFAATETRDILKRVWPWVLAGVAVGALLHGYVPQSWIQSRLGAGQWWATPAAVALGIPLYANATGIIPVMESLMTKGLPLGTTLAFCMSTVGASLPEAMMLRQVMTGRLLVLFFGTLLVLFTLTGWFFNLCQSFLFPSFS